MNKKLRYLTTYTALIALLLILSGVSIAAGSISIPAGEIIKVLAGREADSTYAQIITRSPAICCRRFSRTRSQVLSFWESPRVQSSSLLSL